MFKNPLLLVALALTGAVAVWGIFDTPGLATFASTVTGAMFTSRGWFIMLTASVLLLACIWLALSPYGKLKLGAEELGAACLGHVCHCRPGHRLFRVSPGLPQLDQRADP